MLQIVSLPSFLQNGISSPRYGKLSLFVFQIQSSLPLTLNTFQKETQ